MRGRVGLLVLAAALVGVVVLLLVVVLPPPSPTTSAQASEAPGDAATQLSAHDDSVRGLSAADQRRRRQQQRSDGDSDGEEGAVLAAAAVLAAQQQEEEQEQALRSGQAGNDEELAGVDIVYTLVVHAYTGASDAGDEARWAALAAALGGPAALRWRARHGVRVLPTVHVHAASGDCAYARGTILDALAVGSGGGAADVWRVACVPPLSANAGARRAAILSADVPPTAAAAAGGKYERRGDVYIVILEDVAAVSPLLLAWIDYAVRGYLEPTIAPATTTTTAAAAAGGGAGATTAATVRLLGASLYAPAYNEVNDTLFEPPASTPFLLQFPPAWGSVYTEREWLRFRRWCVTRVDAINNATAALVATSTNPTTKVFPPLDLAAAYSNRWPSATSWRKWLVRFAAKVGGVFLYPPRDVSFVQPDELAACTGHPRNANEPSDRSIFLTPLAGPASASAAAAALDGDADILVTDAEAGDGDGGAQAAAGGSAGAGDVLAAFMPLPPLALAELPALDLYHRPLPAGVAATTAALKLPVQESDGCTVILTVYSRLATLMDRLNHLAHAGPAVRMVIVIWNNVDVPPLVLADGAFPIPVIIKPQTRNSMNNRFAPQPEIATECIMTMDDDADIAYPVLELVSRVWHSHFFDRAVGIFGRRHYRSNEEDTCGQYVYEMVPNNEAPSMVLPTAMAFHRSLLAAYQELPPWLLQTVDDVINCDDLLFNMLVANVSGKPPVLLGTQARAIADLSGRGLFSRPQHRTTRSWCLNVFARAFPGGDLPLRCGRMQATPRGGYTLTDAMQHVPPARDEVLPVPCDLSDHKRAAGTPDCVRRPNSPG